MATVGAYEAKTHLSQLLDRVARGERITITKHGHPVAVLIPAAETPELDRETALEQLRTFGTDRRLGDLTVGELVREGRRS